MLMAMMIIIIIICDIWSDKHFCYDKLKRKAILNSSLLSVAVTENSTRKPCGSPIVAS